MIVRQDGKLIRGLILGICILLTLVQAVEGQDQCSLCADGSDPDMSLSSDDLGWNCWDLNTFASILKEGESECTELQIVGFQDCACPTFPDGFCTLCPGGFSDIPDKTTSVPSTNNLTCGDILFVEETLLQGGCEDLAPYRDRCGCPAEADCTFCADGNTPVHSNRVLPYLNTATSQTTCGVQASLAFSATTVDQCDMYTVPPVNANAQGYCGCQGTFPSDLCTLCPAGMAVTNPALVVPETGGMTCLQMEEYLRYVTDENDCQTISTSAQVCCEALEACPVCPDGPNVEYSPDKLYPPYDMTCENIGLAGQYGFPMTCDDVKMRFPYYCDCPGAVPACTLCQLGELPPETDKPVPLLGTTCEEVNDYASIRLASECAAEKANQPFAASAFCGCTGFEAPKVCSFCPEDEIVRDTAFVPAGAGGATCGEMADFADYVLTANLCSSVQSFASECCMNPGDATEEPSTGPPPPPTAPPDVPAPTMQPGVPTVAPSTSPPGMPTSSPTSSSGKASLFLPTAIVIFVVMVAHGGF